MEFVERSCLEDDRNEEEFGSIIGNWIAARLTFAGTSAVNGSQRHGSMGEGYRESGRGAGRRENHGDQLAAIQAVHAARHAEAVRGWLLLEDADRYRDGRGPGSL